MNPKVNELLGEVKVYIPPTIREKLSEAAGLIEQEMWATWSGPSEMHHERKGWHEGASFALRLLASSSKKGGGDAKSYPG